MNVSRATSERDQPHAKCKGRFDMPTFDRLLLMRIDDATSKTARPISIRLRIFHVAAFLLSSIALFTAITQIRIALPLSGYWVADQLRNRPYESFSGSEQAFNEFKTASGKHTLHMKLIHAWSADTDANRQACLREWINSSEQNTFCTVLRQRIILALEPEGRQPLFVSFVPVYANTRIPIGKIVEIKERKFRMNQTIYELPSSTLKVH